MYSVIHVFQENKDTKDQQPMEYAVVDINKAKITDDKREKVCMYVYICTYVHNWFIEGFQNGTLVACNPLA